MEEPQPPRIELEAAADDISSEERQRINFQLINWMNPSLMLLSNPVALRREIEMGGASLASSSMNKLLGDLRDGRLNIVDTTAFSPGRNLAMALGKVV